MTGRVRVTRAGFTESAHRFHSVVADVRGRILAHVGDPSFFTFFRSSAKPFQTLPLVFDGVADRLGITKKDLAVCCASHGGEAVHLEQVRSLLGRVGLSEDDLECGVRPPLRRHEAYATLRRGREFTQLHNNCSGKHAGMLALAVGMGWPTRGYVSGRHPVQRRVRAEVARWTASSVDSMSVGRDGCCVPTYGFSVHRMAWAYARLAEESRVSDSPASRVVGAMTAHPHLVAGTGMLDSETMRRTSEPVFVKSGAEGLVCAGIPGLGLGVALKVEDGARRAAELAFLRVVHAVGALTDGELEALASPSRTAVFDTRGSAVGGLAVEPGSLASMRRATRE